jgi:hypothetical protein
MGQIDPDLGIWVLSKTFVGLSQKRWGIGTLIGQGKVLISHDSSRFSRCGRIGSGKNGRPSVVHFSRRRVHCRPHSLIRAFLSRLRNPLPHVGG